jgi:hypothetical protein
MPTPPSTLRIAALLAMVLLCLPVDALGTDPPAGAPGHGPQKHQVGRIRGTRTNRHGTHYLFGMSAIPLEKGEGFYKNTLVSVNAANYGLTRHLSVGAGVELLSVITGREAGPVYFVDAKLAADISEVMHVGLNAVYINYPFPANLDDPQFTERRPGFSIITAAATIGDADHQITFSGGVSNDQDAGRVRPAASVSGMARFFPRAALITENWLFFDDPDDYTAWSVGVRFIGQTVAVDVALVNNKQIREELLPIGMPIVNVAVAF